MCIGMSLCFKALLVSTLREYAYHPWKCSFTGWCLLRQQTAMKRHTAMTTSLKSLSWKHQNIFALLNYFPPRCNEFQYTGIIYNIECSCHSFTGAKYEQSFSPNSHVVYKFSVFRHRNLSLIWQNTASFLKFHLLILQLSLSEIRQKRNTKYV